MSIHTTGMSLIGNNLMAPSKGAESFEGANKSIGHHFEFTQGRFSRKAVTLEEAE
jgi:hypothetical protein